MDDEAGASLTVLASRSGVLDGQSQSQHCAASINIISGVLEINTIPLIPPTYSININKRIKISSKK